MKLYTNEHEVNLYTNCVLLLLPISFCCYVENWKLPLTADNYMEGPGRYFDKSFTEMFL